MVTEATDASNSSYRLTSTLKTSHPRSLGQSTSSLHATTCSVFHVPWDGNTISPPDPNRRFTLYTADFIFPNMNAWRLMWDVETLKQVGDTVPGNTPLQNLAITTANEIMNIFINSRRGDGDEGVTTDNAVRTQKAVLAAREVTGKAFGEDGKPKVQTFTMKVGWLALERK